MRAANVFYRREFLSTYDAMSDALQGALASLIERDWIEPEEEFYARLCLEEALVNAIQHGNEGDASRRVAIELAEVGDSCRIRICDEGRGFCCKDITVPECHQKGGRGLCLIRHFMDHVEYNRAQNCFEMSFRRKTLSNKGG